jgi:hypothetical protein
VQPRSDLAAWSSSASRPAQLDGVELAVGAPDPHAHVLVQPRLARIADPLFVADVGGNERLPACRQVGHRAGPLLGGPSPAGAAGLGRIST